MRNAECGLWNIKSKIRNKEMEGMRSAKCGMLNADCGMEKANLKIRT